MAPPTGSAATAPLDHPRDAYLAPIQGDRTPNAPPPLPVPRPNPPRHLARGPGPRGRDRLLGHVLPTEGAFGAYLGIWPLWIERLGAPVTVVGLVLGSSGLLRLFVLAPSATLAERFGARRLIIGARTAAGLGLLSAAFAQHWSHLFVMVVLSALGEIAFPLIQSHVATHAAPKRVRSFTLVFTVGPSVALGLGPLLSGALIALSGLRAAFVLAAVLTALSVLCFARLRGFDHDAGATPVAPASYRDALAETSIRRLLALQGATVFALALGTSFVPTFLEDVRGFSAATIAQMGAGAAVGSALFGLAVSRVGRLQRAPFVGAAIAVGALGVGFVIFLTTASTILLAVAWVCRGGLFAARPPRSDTGRGPSPSAR